MRSWSTLRRTYMFGFRCFEHLALFLPLAALLCQLSWWPLTPPIFAQVCTHDNNYVDVLCLVVYRHVLSVYSIWLAPELNLAFSYIKVWIMSPFWVFFSRRWILRGQNARLFQQQLLSIHMGNERMAVAHLQVALEVNLAFRVLHTFPLRIASVHFTNLERPTDRWFQSELKSTQGYTRSTQGVCIGMPTRCLLLCGVWNLPLQMQVDKTMWRRGEMLLQHRREKSRKA